MQYLLLIYSEEPTAPPAQEDIDASMAEWYAYDKAIKDSGVHRPARRCSRRSPRRQSGSRATSVWSPTDRSPRRERCSAGST